MKIRRQILSCIPVLIGTLLLAACGDDASQPPEEKPLRPVRFMEVSPVDYAAGKEFIAVVDAAQKADLSFKVAGEIIAFPVNQGDQVKTDQLIARLNDTDLQIQYRDAKSAFDKADADLTRGKQLFKSNTISRADFDQLNAQFSSAKAHLDGARNNLDYTRLTAPFDGIIARKYVDNFVEINAKQPVVALHDISRVRLKINIPETIMINAGNQPPELTARFDALEGKTFDLSFEEVATQPDEVTKTYEVILSMAAPPEYNILPGMTARVFARKANNASQPPRIFVPPGVVLKDANGNFVWGVRDDKDGTATIIKKPVQAGDISQLGIEILDGLAAGDLVLTAGMSKVSDGMKVRY